ncbi:pyruvate kinase [Desulfobotulus alkaliphilus]|uniref:Pyruvate kinase n=1 Tax=Desulfobotulus alkaliphilus TaxID=622671 RepID=A0A562RNV1_9BACT|nr:pyruvate kinase [Desulfobotulus alkaliphilus]TWI70757.1 pyruvate kinase [Desulfobotulus alkaliphilus]
MQKTKIICTIGPACSAGNILEEMILAGMRGARLNFSHGSHADHGLMVRRIRSISEKLNIPVAILQDLCGPKIRVGKLSDEGVRLVAGSEVRLTTLGEGGPAIPVTYEGLARDVRVGDTLLLADGMMELFVLEKGAFEIGCRVVTGGVLTSGKGINLPSGTLNIPALTEKDRLDLEFGLGCGVDYVALSFVRSAADIREVKTLVAAFGQDTPVIAKIEKHEALDHMAEILGEADGIMVARGDLGVEIPLENVPDIQKDLVRMANRAGKPVIIATQMMKSMVESPRPTRAEANDVANAVLDGTDALMLSEETAMGTFPVEAVQYMAKIAARAERIFPHERYREKPEDSGVPGSVARASAMLADELDAAAVVAPTRSGFTAAQIARFRPRCPILALSPEAKVVQRLCLHWGCIPGLFEEEQDTDTMIEKAGNAALEAGLAKAGQAVILTAGHPIWQKGTTNMVKVRVL